MTLLFLGASVSQLPAMRYARAAGYRVVAVDGDPDAVGFSLADVPLVLDFADVDAVTELAARHEVRGVLAVCSDRAVLPAATVACRLGLPGVDPDVARTMTNKALMRTTLEHAGLRQPRHQVLRRDAPPPGIGFPAVLKPVDSGGQRGLFRLGSLDDLHAHLETALAFSRCGRAIVEEFVEGPELNAMIAVRGGEPTTLTLSDRLRPRGVGFGVGWIHLFPSTLDADILDEARSVAEQAVRAVGLQDGIAFPQLIASPAGVVVVEIAARIAAGQMADLVRHATGIELYEIAIRQAVGTAVGDELVTPVHERPVAIRFLTAAPGLLPVGPVRAVDGLDDVRAAPGVLDAGLYFGVGATLNPVQVDADRYGYVIATGESAGDALTHADAAARRLHVETDAPRRRRRRTLAAVLVAALAAATIAGFILPGKGKLQHALVAAVRPQITHVALRIHGRRFVIGYAFSEPAHALLVVDGERAVFSPLAVRKGILRWSGTFPGGRRLSDRHALIRLVAVDSIGYRSRPVVVGR
jgi:biotin carboxylase